MIVIRIFPHAGMGNQMFMYAAGLATAKRLNTELRLGIWGCTTRDKHRPYELACFPAVTEPPASFNELWNICPYQAVMSRMEHAPLRKYHLIRRTLRSLWSKLPRSFREKGTYRQDTYKKMLEMPDNKIMFGYWIGRRYLTGVEDILREKFRFAPECFNPVLSAEIRQSNSVALHVRRDDKVNNSLLLASDETYLKASIEKISSLTNNPKFFVFSDDIEWCRKTLPKIHDGEYIFVDGQRPGHDMALITICRHIIMGPSTFSWWGAWLNENPNKIVIAPEHWVRKNRPAKLGEEDDLLSDEWIKL